MIIFKPCIVIEQGFFLLDKNFNIYILSIKGSGEAATQFVVRAL